MDEKEVKGKLLRVGIVRPHKTEYLIKNLLGNEPYAIMPTQKQILSKVSRHWLSVARILLLILLLKNNRMNVKFKHFGRYR